MWGVGGRSWGDAGVLVPDLGDGYTGVHSKHVYFPIHRKTSFFFLFVFVIFHSLNKTEKKFK